MLLSIVLGLVLMQEKNIFLVLIKFFQLTTIPFSFWYSWLVFGTCLPQLSSPDAHDLLRLPSDQIPKAFGSCDWALMDIQ
jgi:hypothetical protein